MTTAWKRALRRARGEEGFGLVEALIAVTILVIGLLAVTGLTLAAATQARVSDWRADMTAAAHVTLEEVNRAGYASAASRTDTITVGGRDVPVQVVVTDLTSRVRQVRVVVSATGALSPDTFTTRLYRPRPLPAPISP